MESYIEGGLFNYYPESPHDIFSAKGRFQEIVGRPDEQIDLAEAALIIAAQEYPGLSEGYYLDRLDAMASDVGLLLAGENDPYQIIQVFNSYLYGTLGFKGNETNYNDPRNSYLNDVLERRTGIPITLSLVYLEIGKRLGLPLEGIGLPGHFIIRYREHSPQTLGLLNMGRERLDDSEATPKQEQILLDPFNGGTIITEEECIQMVREVYGRPVPFLSGYLRPVGPRQFLTRMLTNLKASYMSQNEFEKAHDIIDFLIILNPTDWSELRDRGLMRQRLGQRWRAIYDYQAYLRRAVDAHDAETVRQQIRRLQDDIAKMN